MVCWVDRAPLQLSTLPGTLQINHLDTHPSPEYLISQRHGEIQRFRQLLVSIACGRCSVCLADQDRLSDRAMTLLCIKGKKTEFGDRVQLVVFSWIPSNFMRWSSAGERSLFKSQTCRAESRAPFTYVYSNCWLGRLVRQVQIYESVQRVAQSHNVILLSNTADSSASNGPATDANMLASPRAALDRHPGRGDVHHDANSC